MLTGRYTPLGQSFQAREIGMPDLTPNFLASKWKIILSDMADQTTFISSKDYRFITLFMLPF
jgi:hypothetical protein